MVVNVEAAIYKNKRWILIKRGAGESQAAGTLSLMGGTIEENDPAVDVLEKTLVREAWEELGISLDPIMYYVCSASFVADDNDFVTNVVFLANYSGPQDIATNPDEVEEVHRMTYDEIMDHDGVADYTKTYIEKAQKLHDELVENGTIELL